MGIVKLFVYKVGLPKKEIEIEDDLKAYQGLVGGYIEAVYLPNDVVLICNEEGKLEDLKPNCALPNGDYVAGDFLLCKVAEDGDFASISKEDAEEAEKYFKLIR